MTPVLLLLAAIAMGSPAVDQQHGQAMPTPQSGNSTCSPEHAAMGHCKLPEADPETAPEAPMSSSTCSPEHAAMGHCTRPEPAISPTPPAPASDPACPPEHAAMGHCTPAIPPSSQDPHAGHDMRSMAVSVVAPGPPPAEALTGPDHAADAYWGDGEMNASRQVLVGEHGGMATQKLLVDRAEARFKDGRDGYLLDLQAWYGGDSDKLWLKSEIEGLWGKKLEHAEVQALWSHAIGPWFDLQTGVRYDPQPGPDRSHLVLGIQGLAPYWWEVEGAVFLSNKGEVTARAEAEYDLRITQRLILQPRGEVNLSLQDVPELALGSGLTNAALGLRLRYQVSPLVAPYVGVEYERAFGGTRRFLKADGEDSGGLNLLAGVRLWF